MATATGSPDLAGSGAPPPGGGAQAAAAEEEEREVVRVRVKVRLSAGRPTRPGLPGEGQGDGCSRVEGGTRDLGCYVRGEA